MVNETEAAVELVAIDDAVLDELVRVAVTEADANEVTPPITPGQNWTPARESWLRACHRDRRAGFDGPLQESTWAITLDGRVVGSIRLRRLEAGAAETGIWLARSARGRGIGHGAFEILLAEAHELGVTTVVADTTAANAGALGILRRAGFVIEPPDADGRVQASLVLAR
ncbi:GNAT family N-acetyltransferase [Nocardia cyriacigeorgica]